MKAAIIALPIDQYGIMGEETGSNGTDHLQGYLQLNQAQTISAFQKKLKKASIKCTILIARGSPDQNYDYCSKDGKTHEWGQMKKAGKRTDLKEIHDLIESGSTMKEIREQFPGDWYRYRRSFEAHKKEAEAEAILEEIKTEMSSVTLRGWQEEVVERLENQTNRQVLWVCDTIGNTGKSYLSKWLFANKGAFEIVSGKTSDIAFAYGGQNIVIFDLSRQKQSYMNYSVIEHFKNGTMFSSKYESNSLRFKPPKVVVFANWEPDYSMLSKDRWDMYIMREVRSDVPVDTGSDVVARHGFFFQD